MSYKNLRQNIGTVSHATMRTEDLIPAFIDKLQDQKPLHREHRKLIREIEERIDQDTSCPHGVDSPDTCEVPDCVGPAESYFDSDDSQEDLDSLFQALEAYALPYFYFGAHPGDGSDYGYWLSESWQEDFDGVIRSSNGFKDTYSQHGQEIDGLPSGYSGHFADISDHGNLTMYSVSRGRKREIFSLV